MNAIETTGGLICRICHITYPYGAVHYCKGLSSGPPVHVLRNFSEQEIREIVRDEIRRALPQRGEQ